jgi:Nif-specific regulatory protein
MVASDAPGPRFTSGLPEIDRLIGGVLVGDNVIWEADSGVPVDLFMSSFLEACESEKTPLIYVSFNSSPQTISKRYARTSFGDRFTLVDCFSSGKGNNDALFLDFFQGSAPGRPRGVHVKKPYDPAELLDVLAHLGEAAPNAGYVFDSLTGMLGLWGNEDAVLRFFSHVCPRLYDLDTVAYWLLEREAHTEAFLARVRHITQVVLDLDVAQGQTSITVRKAVGRRCENVGIPRRFTIDDNRLLVTEPSREGRDLALLGRLGEALESALEPESFFDRALAILDGELGMQRGTLSLLDRSSNRLRIAAAHGLTPAQRGKGDYALGEGITGHVVKTGRPEAIPDIRKDPRFLDRTTARRGDADRPTAFICVPVKLDDEVIGALSADRPYAEAATLEKDLRLLAIIASMVSQVLKINSLVNVEKEKILARDERLLGELRSRYKLDNVVGQSEPVQRILAAAATAAESHATILVTGETGTGKELVAHVIHYNSRRAGGPFVKVNCGALPESLLESELFGHVKGAFTGAVRDRKGRFELAHGGTLFLDEASEMVPRLQVKLLRILQEMEYEPVGSEETRRVDVRIVAATNKDLRAEIAAGRFREDLFYRLNVVAIHLPPLRERKADIPSLVDHFLDRFNREYEKSVSKLSRNILDLLLAYPWPGNVRELENCIERAVVLSHGDALSPDHLPPEILHARRGATPRSGLPSSAENEVRRAAGAFCESVGDLADARNRLLRAVEETLIRKALRENLPQRELADRLGMSRMTLRKKMRQYGIS